VNIEHYRQRLLELEKQLSARAGRESALGRDQTADSSRDAGDASVADEAASEDFTEVAMDSTIVQQVRDALQRIDDGTFGKCVVDGGPIEPQRLEAVPWTQYCLKHQTILEGSATKMPTL
jgi:DnaK suppressor protein